MNAYIREIVAGTWSLIVGMAVTIRFFFRPVVTLQYPHQSVEMTPRFRGHIDLVLDERKGTNKCIVCNACAKACPSNCITLEGEKREGVKQKVLTVYQLDFSRCSLCGLCVESCPTEAIGFSKDYNLVGSAESEFVFDLLKRLEDRKQ